MEESRNADDMAGKELENLGAVPISYVSPMSSPYDAHVAMSAFMTPPYATGFPSLTQQPMFYSLNWHGPTVPPTAERPMHGAHGAHSQSFSTRGESSKPTPSTQRTREADLAADSPASARKTLFIAGFPPDVKEREIYNLLRFQPGFVDCSLIPSANGKQAIAFASWADHQSAARCRDLLQGLRFDPYGLVTFLRVQFAHSESKSKRAMLEKTSMAAIHTSSSSNPATPSTNSPIHVSPPPELRHAAFPNLNEAERMRDQDSDGLQMSARSSVSSTNLAETPRMSITSPTTTGRASSSSSSGILSPTASSTTAPMPSTTPCSTATSTSAATTATTSTTHALNTNIAAHSTGGMMSKAPSAGRKGKSSHPPQPSAASTASTPTSAPLPSTTPSPSSSTLSPSGSSSTLHPKHPQGKNKRRSSSSASSSSNKSQHSAVDTNTNTTHNTTSNTTNNTTNITTTTLSSSSSSSTMERSSSGETGHLNTGMKLMKSSSSSPSLKSDVSPSSSTQTSTQQLTTSFSSSSSHHTLHQPAGSSTHLHGSSTSTSSQQQISQNQPSSQRTCRTLFVTNLNLLTTEDDLRRLFEQCTGFRRLRFQLNTEGMPVGFVDFDTLENSSAARTAFQGTEVHHSPIRIEFAKQQMKRSRKRTS